MAPRFGNGPMAAPILPKCEREACPYQVRDYIAPGKLWHGYCCECCFLGKPQLHGKRCQRRMHPDAVVPGQAGVEVKDNPASYRNRVVSRVALPKHGVVYGLSKGKPVIIDGDGLDKAKASLYGLSKGKPVIIDGDGQVEPRMMAMMAKSKPVDAKTMAKKYVAVAKKFEAVQAAAKGVSVKAKAEAKAKAKRPEPPKFPPPKHLLVPTPLAPPKRLLSPPPPAPPKRLLSPPPPAPPALGQVAWHTA